MKVQTSVGAQDMTTHVRIDVTDTGVGIAPKDQQRAFEPFFTTKAPDKGTGLGLSVSRAIVEDFGGRIWMESQPAQGTTMTVILPSGVESSD